MVKKNTLQVRKSQDKTIPPKRPEEPTTYFEFVRFIGTPRQFREIEFGYDTDAEFARNHNICARTLYKWKNREGFWDEVKHSWQTRLKDKTPDTLGAMYKKILMTGDAAEVRLWHEIVENWTPKQRNELIVNRQTIKNIQDGVVAIIENEKFKDQQKERQKVGNDTIHII